MSRMRITSLAIGLLWMLAMPLTAYGQSATLPLLPTEEGDSELQSMVDQLRAIAEQAKRDRSADFRLLQQLGDLAGRYDQPWRITLLEDSFADGDFTANPAWAVASGNFNVDSRYGLRNRVIVQTRIDFGSGGQNEGQAALQLFGALLGGIAKQQSGGGQEPASRAEIHTGLAISEAFSATLEFGVISKAVEGGGLSFGVYRGAGRDTGYRLLYSQGRAPSLTMQRLSPAGISTIASVPLAKGFEDGAYHRITLRRGQGGIMEGLIDDVAVLSGTDPALQAAPFDGFTLINRGGEFAFRRVTVMGSAL